jgi:hypothetical protein
MLVDYLRETVMGFAALYPSYFVLYAASTSGSRRAVERARAAKC